jgi:serine/threonine-protein kinase
MLGRYRLVAELGRGAMGVVFLAEDSRLRERLCVKVLQPALADNLEAVERFHREIVLARRIHHAGVCRIFDLHEDGGVRFLTMEHVEGANLADLLASSVFSPERTAKLGATLCDALAAAHDVGVIHRDLKPRNIIVRAGDAVSILDFGVATALDLSSSLTLPGAALGTHHYIAPEVWAGRPATPKADQFAVGVVLFNCLTGKMPFAAARGALLLDEMRRGPPPPPSRLRPDGDARLDDVVLRALSFAPEQRFADVRAVGAALSAAIGVTGLDAPGAGAASASPKRALESAIDVPTAVLPPPPPNDTTLATSRRAIAPRVAASAAAALVVAIAIAAILPAPPARDGSRQPTASPPMLPALPALPPPASVALDVEPEDVDGAAPEVASEPVMEPTVARAGRSSRTPRSAGRDGRVAVARAALERAAIAKGVLGGDDVVLDRLRGRASSALKAGRLGDAEAAFEEATGRVDALVIDKTFVRRKLVRFNARFDALDAAARARLDPIAAAVLAALAAGRYEEANRRLNDGFAALEEDR